MKKLLFISLTTLLSTAVVSAQSSFKIGSTTVALPENKIMTVESDYSVRANYLKFSNDTMFYYETYGAKGDDSQNTLTIYVLPAKYIDKEYTNFNENRNEYFDGRTDMQYYTVINLRYDIPKNVTGWRYTYDSKGKVKKKKDSYVFVYSDDKKAFEFIKDNVK